jgi:hypothetical protein
MSNPAGAIAMVFSSASFVSSIRPRERGDEPTVNVGIIGI